MQRHRHHQLQQAVFSFFKYFVHLSYSRFSHSTYNFSRILHENQETGGTQEDAPWKVHATPERFLQNCDAKVELPWFAFVLLLCTHSSRVGLLVLINLLLPGKIFCHDLPQPRALVTGVASGLYLTFSDSTGLIRLFFFVRSFCVSTLLAVPVLLPSCGACR